MAHAHRKFYVFIFVVLFLLTGLEVGVVYLPISWGLMVSALVLLAVGKAVLVAQYFMHLKSETKVLRWTVYVPLSIPVFYALVLISEAAWRML